MVSPAWFCTVPKPSNTVRFRFGMLAALITVTSDQAPYESRPVAAWMSAPVYVPEPALRTMLVTSANET